MEERGEEMRVVDSYGELDQNIVVAETALLQTVLVSLFSQAFSSCVYTSQW